MENIKLLAEFIKVEYPNDGKDLAEALDLVTLALDGVYDSIGKSMQTYIQAQQLDEISSLTLKLHQILDIKKAIDDYSILFIDTEAFEDEIIAEVTEEEFEKIDIPNYSDYALDTSVPHSLYEDFTHTKACGFQLNSTVYEARNMRGVIIKLCEVLAEENPNKIVGFIKDPSMKGRKAPYFSDKFIIEDGVNKNEKIANLDVYVWVNLSCNQIRNVIKRVLKKFDLPFECLKIFLRADYKELHKKDELPELIKYQSESSEKIGKYVQSCFENLANYNFNQNELIAMQSEKWTLDTFGFSIPLLKKYDNSQPYQSQIKINGNNRYWKNPYEIAGDYYFVVSQWQCHHRKRFGNWFNNLNLQEETK